MSVMYILCLQAPTLAKKQSIFKVFFITQLDHGHCLATIALIVYFYSVCDD